MSYRNFGLAVIVLGSVLGLACQKESNPPPGSVLVGTPETVVSDDELRDQRATDLKVAVDEALKE